MDITRYFIRDRVHGLRSVGFTRLNKTKQAYLIYSETIWSSELANEGYGYPKAEVVCSMFDLNIIVPHFECVLVYETSCATSISW